MSRSTVKLQMARWMLFMPAVLLSVIFSSLAITNFVSLPDFRFPSYAYDVIVIKGYASASLGLITLGCSVLIAKVRPDID